MSDVDLSYRAGLPRTGAGDNDAALAKAIARGDVEAWERFFEQYAPWAYRFAYQHLGGNRADAEDLCSDIMAAAARSMRSFDAVRATLDLWLLGLARHRLAHFCRSRRAMPPLVPASDVPDPEQSDPLADLPTDGMITRDLVNRALSSLPARQAEVLVGKYVSGYSVEELAHGAECSPKAVESLLARARAGFRAAFRQLADGGSAGESHER